MGTSLGVLKDMGVMTDSPLRVMILGNGPHHQRVVEKLREASLEVVEGGSYSPGPTDLVVLPAEQLPCSGQAANPLGVVATLSRHELLGKAAAGVAHDLNNLLAVILGNISILADTHYFGDEIPEEIQAIEQAGMLAAQLTSRLLGLARAIPQGTSALVDLNSIVSLLPTMLRHSMDGQIHCEFVSDPKLPLVKGDPVHLFQMCLNLCLNARDAMPTGGRLRVETRKVELGEPPARSQQSGRAGNFVCLQVTDTGTGIAPEVRARMLEPFFTTKEPGKGLGLGLTLVHQIVHAHSGWLECQSEPGRGTSFEVFLPCN